MRSSRRFESMMGAALGVLGMLAAGAAPALADSHQAELRYQWSALDSDAPLAGHSAVVTGDGRMIVLGGEAGFGSPGTARQLDLSDDGLGWSDLSQLGDVPVPRQPGRGLLGARAVVDPDDGLLLLVCDCSDGQTYVLDMSDGSWARFDTEVELPLWYPTLVYDAARDRALLIGGDLFGTNTLSTGVWSFDLSATRSGWQALPDAPIQRLHQAAAIDAQNDRIILAGGQDEEGRPVSETWLVDLEMIDSGPDAWSRVPVPADASWPQARVGASLVVHAGRQVALLYGGYAARETGAEDLGDLWSLPLDAGDRPQWELIEDSRMTGDLPGIRAGHSAVFDPASARMLVFGGTRTMAGNTEYLDDGYALELDDSPVGSTIFMPIAHNGELN